MMRALFAAIGGLRNHMTYMDVVSTNIANVNTNGYKTARVTFQDMLRRRSPVPAHRQRNAVVPTRHRSASA